VFGDLADNTDFAGLLRAHLAGLTRGGVRGTLRAILP
jgi:hypothetical protein